MQEKRQRRLARVDNQLRELYGPLSALVEMNEQIWSALRNSWLPSQAERRPEVESNEWASWRAEALMPTNRQMRDLIVRHADLLVGNSFPKVLADFCSHVAAQEVLVGNSELQTSSLIAHPGAPYVKYVREVFLQLKAEQLALLQEQN